MKNVYQKNVFLKECLPKFEVPDPSQSSLFCTNKSVNQASSCCIQLLCKLHSPDSNLASLAIFAYYTQPIVEHS